MKHLIILSVTLLFVACNSKKKEMSKEHDVYYTCSMDPQVVEYKPGKCPICKMDLTPVKKSKGEVSDEIKLSEQQIQLGNIKYDTLYTGSIEDKVVLTATLNFDQMKATSISSKIMGRVEKLYYKNIGDYIKKGSPLFDLYSDELNNAKQEYLLAQERKKTLKNDEIDFDQLIKSAKNKLLLWGMSEAQIIDLVKSKKTTSVTTFYSNVSGFITELDVREGDYANEGGTIVKLADISTILAEGQVYTSQLSEIDRKETVIVQIPDLNNLEIRGNVEFVNPEINPDTRINLIRVSIPNPNEQLKPGMPAYVILKSRQHKSFSLPIDAVIRDGKGATVWVKTGSHTFKSKMVETGIETGDRIEIKSGLQASDVVVISGAYLLNSEYIFKKGSNPMEGHDMSKM